MTNLYVEMMESLRESDRPRRAAWYILEYLDDAPHHRQYGIDQALRLLLGETYQHVINLWETRTGEEWDTGIP